MRASKHIVVNIKKLLDDYINVLEQNFKNFALLHDMYLDILDSKYHIFI